MSERMLHILAPARYDSVGAIVGDLAALYYLRSAISDAIESGTGGTFLSQSDGEGYSLAIICAIDMDNVCTTYAGELYPTRSKRETVSIRGMPRFADALRKASASEIRPLYVPGACTDLRPLAAMAPSSAKR